MRRGPTRAGGAAACAALAALCAALPLLPGGTAVGASSVAQRGELRVTVDGRLRPRKLPRTGAAPIAVSVAGQVSTADGSLPPQLKRLRIELNRHGRLNPAGLPVCRYRSIQPASTRRALAACRPALVGTGSFTANIGIAGQQAYPAKGRLLVFNSRRKGRPVLYGHIYSPRPFATSFVIVFALRDHRTGTYGVALVADLPRAMGSWGNLTGLEMTLSRRFRHRGRSRSYVTAGCPAPPGFPGATFPLARTSFFFAGGLSLRTVLRDRCAVRR